ncbi:MAG: hypothetical protein NT167_26460, partial [Verrucomicrobia bacterium]|nr:hypothetical protein [Verrucomicrobiota bacterium]
VALGWYERRPWRLKWWKLFEAVRDLGESYYRKRQNHCHWNMTLKSWRHWTFLSAVGLRVDPHAKADKNVRAPVTRANHVGNI